MKIYLLLTLFTIINAMGSVFPQSGGLTISLKDATVLEVFNTIENQSKFKFFYQNEQIDVLRKVNIQVQQARIEDVLNTIFANENVKYRILEDNLIVLTAEILQQISITGTVTATSDGSALPGVNIVEKGTTNGVITDIDGKYSIAVGGENSILVFSFVGYKTVEVAVAGQSVINVKLEEEISKLDEVVVVGYGIEKKSLVTGSISKIKSEDLGNTSLSRVDQAIQGKTSGVVILPNSGSPGSGSKVRIRGAGTSGNSEPLYIVDGVKTDNIDFLDPNDIASVEILKDAASSAIYGTEAANGVIMVTSKSGSAKKGIINYNYQFGSQSVGKKMDLMNAQEYITYMREAGTDTITGFSGSGTNWLNEIFDNAPMQRHNLSFTGGNEISSYMVSGSYYTQKGVVGSDKAKFDRYTGRFNSDHKVTKWLTLSNKFSYSHYERSGIEEGNRVRNVLASAMLIDPLTPVTYSGTLPSHVQTRIDEGRKLVKDPAGNYYGLSQYIAGEIANPVALIQLEHGKVSTDKLVGSFDATITPIKDVSFTSRLGIDYSSELTNTWEPSYWFSSERSKDVPSVTDSVNNWFTLQWENFATIKKSFNDHSFTLLLGMSSEELRHKNLTTLTDGMFREEDEFAQHGKVSKDGKITGNLDKIRLASYFGRIFYNYKERYMLQASLRRDGSSLLAPGKNWGNFPSLSAGWVLSKENFLQSLDFLTHLKLRASWGQNGSLSNLSVDQFRSLISTTGLKYPGGGIAAEPPLLANDELTWEKSEQTDIGLDIRFLKDKLSLTTDYFIKTTKDLLIPSTPPLSTGNYAPFANAGDVKNSGFEIELSYRDNVGDFKYGINVNFSKLKNEVTRLNPVIATSITGGQIGTGWYATYFEKGQPIWYFRGYKTDGIFQTQQQINNYIAQNNLTGYNPKPGDPIVVNSNKDNLINEGDYTYIGSPHPDAIFGSSINMEYKGFDFSVFMQGSLGNDIVFGFNRTDRITSNKPKFYYTDRWTGPNSTNSWFRADNSNKFAYESDLMVFDGSYMRIKQIQLGYTLPSQISQIIKMSKARIYVSLDDYFTFTKYPGMDPEANDYRNDAQGIDRGVYPIPRKIIAGINITF
jgi:TonB-linked SusC/RagA family outer membrane protein